MKRWGLFLLGGGIGMIVGVQVGGPAMVLALVAVGSGLFLLAARARSGGRDLVADATVARVTAAGDDEVPGGEPALKGLGGQVDRILRLAEEQAADHIAQAEATAAQIVAQARAEAEHTKPSIRSRNESKLGGDSAR